MSDLNSTVLLLEAVVSDLDNLLTDGTVTDLDEALVARSILATTSVGLSQCREQLDTLIGDAMGEYRVVVEGHGQIERHKKKSRTKWDREGLLRDVLDSRMVDTETGEWVDETPLEKVLQVWNLAAPRTSALKARGLDGDQYCETETRPGWTVKVG